MANFNLNSENVLPNITNEATQNISNTYEKHRGNAILYLFTPRSLVNTCKRPHVYNFDLNFVEQLADNVNKVMNSSSINYNDAAFMDNYSSSVNAVSVTDGGLIMENKRLEDFWTFLLQLDNEQLSNSIEYKGHKLCNRIVWSGYCCNEPVSSLDGLRVTVNPNCVLKITHCTTLQLINNHFTPGGFTEKIVTESDIDFILPDITQMLNPQVEYLLTPDAIFKNTGMDENNTFYESSNASLVGSHTPIPINTWQSSPKQHLKEVVGTVLGVFEDTGMNSILSGNVRDSIGNQGLRNHNTGLFASTSSFRNSFFQNLPKRPADNIVSLDGTQSYSISELQQKYPMMQIVPVGAPKLSLDNMADQATPTTSNIGSSIVVTAVPMLLNDVGLCELSLLYRSHTATDAIFLNNEQDAFKILNFASWMPEPEGLVKIRLKTFMTQFKKQIVPILRHIGGEFDLSISVNSASECDCLLIYLDEPHGTQGIYESPLLLGGLNNPLLGDSNVFNNNGINLNLLVTSMETKHNDNNFIPQLPNTMISPDEVVVTPKSGTYTPNVEYAEQFFNNQKF